MKLLYVSMALSFFGNCVAAETQLAEVLQNDTDTEIRIVPVHGILDRPQYVVLIQRIASQDDAERTLRACLIGDLEHPRSHDMEDMLSQDQRNEIQKVRDGIEKVCILYDRDGGEAYVIQIDNIETSMLGLSEVDTEALKDLIRRSFGRYHGESTKKNITVVLIARESSFDEVLKVFAACRPVIGLSQRTSRAPYTFHIVLDKDVTLDEFLEESRKRIPHAYRQLIRDAERRALRDGAMYDYMNSSQVAKKLLYKDMNLSLMNIDDAQELLIHGQEPVFVAYQDYVAA